ncbi:hypothetical protein GCM10029964_092700 [Kibdelosporangium lantanae]
MDTAAAEVTALPNQPDEDGYGRRNNLSSPLYRLRQALIGAKATFGADEESTWC